MKIRTKLFLSLAATAFVSVLLATFFAIYSISENYEEIAREATADSRRKAENIFYEYLGDLTRKATFISELQEVIKNLDNPGELSISLENKGFFLFNINTKILSPDMDIIVSYANSSNNTLSKVDLKNSPFFQPGRDSLLRDIGIFRMDDQICILAVSPIVDQTDFSFKGYVLFELFFNSEFADQLKDKAGCDIVILSNGEQLATSFQNNEGERFFPGFSQDPAQHKKKKKILNENYLIDGFSIFDYHKQPIGSILVAENVKNILVAKSQGIRNILLVLVIASLLAIVVSLVVGRKLSQPLLALSSSAQAISKGNFDVRIEPTSEDEIGDLSKTFADMAKSLKTQREEILDLKVFFEKIINNSPSALIICDESGEVISFNPAAEKILDTPFSDIKGKNIFETVQFTSSIKADFYNVILSGHPTYHDPYPQFLPSKEEKIFRLTLYKIELKKGISVAIQIEDITERLRMEEDLTH
ncbi:MAG: HAMP domain-containing protein, partial [Candidatus Aminicenantes bacterium]|nr:HAMP domain-containing protein [Candidatus Aminicenantes bacterium]